jgi:hypothetical protein
LKNYSQITAKKGTLVHTADSYWVEQNVEKNSHVRFPKNKHSKLQTVEFNGSYIYIYIYIYIKSCTSKFMPQLKKQRISVFHNKYIKVQSLMGIKV